MKGTRHYPTGFVFVGLVAATRIQGRNRYSHSRSLAQGASPLRF